MLGHCHSWLLFFGRLFHTKLGCSIRQERSRILGDHICSVTLPCNSKKYIFLSVILLLIDMLIALLATKHHNIFYRSIKHYKLIDNFSINLYRFPKSGHVANYRCDLVKCE